MYIFKRFKIKKKGSLSLSINAIVVLILAMSMLGLGIAFTKNMFGKLAGQIKVPPPPIEATANEPIVVAGDVEFRHNKEHAFAVNYYNDFDDGRVYPSIRCFGDLDASPADTKGGIGGLATATEAITDNEACRFERDCVVRVAPQRVEPGTSKTFQFIIPKVATKAISNIQDVCEISFCVGDKEGNDWENVNGEWVCKSGQSESAQITVKVI
jgi:hypothetical protein